MGLFACLVVSSLVLAADERPLPVLHVPDPKIVEVYRGNWENTLKPCILPPSDELVPKDRDSEPQRPWKVDVEGHYPGWYPGVDMKHSAAAYLACQKDLALVLRAWKVTTERYQMPDGAIRAMTMNGNPNSVVPEATAEQRAVYYPLRLTGCIDYLLLGDMIYRFSQDLTWLKENIDHLERTAGYILGWVDDEGLLDSDSYDLDQVYRQIDGVANAAAIDALRRLAKLEGAVGDAKMQEIYEARTLKMSAAVREHFWDPARGYFAEHLTYNNRASARAGGAVTASAALDAEHPAAKAIDGILGCGFDAFGVGIGVAGKHEWASAGDEKPWIKVTLKEATQIDKVIVFNRTEPSIGPADRFTTGLLEFSDGAGFVDVDFNALKISRGIVSFPPRTVTWVKFTGLKTEAPGPGHPGLAEFMVMPADGTYVKHTHGMTDTNFAVMGFSIYRPDLSEISSAWKYFKANEPAFYEVNGLAAPTWISEDAASYTEFELNRRAPRKDSVAMGRTWRYDALMRRAMGDGEGLYNTILFANTLYDRPSGGGPGFFAERYGLGRFQPGDESQANVLKYAEYPAVYNSTVVQQCLMGLEVDHAGTIRIAPCVPEAWYAMGVGMENPGLLAARDLGFRCYSDHVSGWVSGAPGPQAFSIALPGGLDPEKCRLYVNGQEMPHEKAASRGNFRFTVEVPGEGRTEFIVR